MVAHGASRGDAIQTYQPRQGRQRRFEASFSFAAPQLAGENISVPTARAVGYFLWPLRG